MSFKANAKLGSLSVQIEAEDMKELIQAATLFAEAPRECECGSTNIMPKHRHVQDYDFYEMCCLDCGHSFKISTSKREGNPLFFDRRTQWEAPYVKDSNDD